MKSSFGSAPARCKGQISGRVVAAIAIAIVAVLAAIYLFFPKPEPVPVPTPVPSAPLETVAPAETEEERGDSARDVIAELKESQDGVDYGQAYIRAQEFYAAGRLADAQLLYFFAARGGEGSASFDLATMYDPNHFSEATSLMDQPDPFQAYKWYREALEAGNDEAGKRLDDLRTWAENAVNDPIAERLLLQWE